VSAALAFAGLTVLTAVVARFFVFTGFSPYDDEGYMLVSLQSFFCK